MYYAGAILDWWTAAVDGGWHAVSNRLAILTIRGHRHALQLVGNEALTRGQRQA